MLLGLLLPRMVRWLAKLAIAHAGRVFEARAIQDDSAMAQHRSEGRIRYGGVRAGPRVDKDVTELTGAGIRYDVVTVPIGVKSVTSDLLTYPPKKTEKNRLY